MYHTCLSKHLYSKMPTFIKINLITLDVPKELKVEYRLKFMVFV